MILKYIEYMYAPILPRWVQRFRTPIALTFCFIVILLAGEPLQNIISEMMATCLLGTTICSHSRIFQLWYSNWQWEILESSLNALRPGEEVWNGDWTSWVSFRMIELPLP